MSEDAPEPKAPQSVEKKERREGFLFAYRSLPSEDHPSRNEDTVLYNKELKLAGIFDGMGGYKGGQDASQLAAASVQEYVSEWDEIADDEAEETIRPSLVNALKYANDKVVDLGHRTLLKITDDEERAKFRPPGTTAAVVKLHEFADGRKIAYIGNVGDSRVYVWRAAAGKIEQVTQDDDMLSVPDFVHGLEETHEREITEADIVENRRLLDTVGGETEMPDSLGKELFRMRNIIVSSLGGGQQPRVRTHTVPLEAGDIILITSDGVHDNLTLARMEAIAATSADQDTLVERLTTEAYEYGHQAPRGYRKDDPRLRNKRDDITAAALKAL